ncbi:Protein CL16A [Coemansia sp. RSA 1250]|nr:Protein CL16A [Coemansia sp. RSA 1250]
MLGPFLTLLGLDDPSKTQPRPTSPTTAATKTAAEQSHESDLKRKQIQQLSTYLNSPKVRSGGGARKRLVESVRQVSEVVIWSDRRNPELLSVCIEMGLHQHMLALLQSRGRQRRWSASDNAVTVQVLQTFSIILDSVSDTKFLYALLSNNFVNELIAAPIDMDNEEVVSYYVAFLKALSLKLTADTIHFFCNERMDDFPLYTTAISLFDHPDSMVRVAVRAITLNVFRINDPRALDFVLHSPKSTSFWEQIVCALKDSYDDAFRILVDMLPGRQHGGSAVATTQIDRAHMSAAQGWAAIDQVLEEHMGLLAYLNDIYGLGVARINSRITAEFSGRILERTLVHAIDIGWRAGASPEETLFMQVVTLFTAHFFSIVRFSPLLVDVITALFSDGSNASGAHLPHPFIPSPFEPSRTLVPWLCAVVEILRNKAIGPTTLVKSALTPRRMLRTRALLESLTGTTSLSNRDCCSSNSGCSLSANVQPPTIAAIAASSPPLNATADSQASPPLPPHTQTIATAMVQILAEDPPSHTWITVDLAALVLAQLTRSSRNGRLVLDPSLSSELAQAQHTRSAELRALLLATNEGTEPDQIGCGSWKVLAQCLADFANSDAETLTMKVQFEARHVFAPEPTSPNLSPMPPGSPSSVPPMQPPSLQQQQQFRRSSTSSSTANPLALLTKAVISPLTTSLASTHSSHTSLPSLSLSPFETPTPHHVSLAASIHQAFRLRLLCAAASICPQPSSNSFVPSLQAWLGQQITSIASLSAETIGFSASVIDNAAKRELPRNVTRLGFSASVVCHGGCLIIEQAHEPAVLEMVWPLADITAELEQEPADGTNGPLCVLHIRDTTPPEPLFFPPRPASMGGINVTSTARKTNRFRSSTNTSNSHIASKRHLAQYSYFGRHPLDISLRLGNAGVCNELYNSLRLHCTISRQMLANIYIDHDVL